MYIIYVCLYFINNSIKNRLLLRNWAREICGKKKSREPNAMEICKQTTLRTSLKHEVRKRCSINVTLGPQLYIPSEIIVQLKRMIYHNKKT